ncbi:MAG: hypothetical protein ABL961_11825 [Vicinamibacterales bacterium]
MIKHITQAWRLALVWAVSLIAIGVAAAALTLAQGAPDKRVVSGSDLGFRVESDRNGVPTGRFVIRVNGQWVEVKESVGPARLTQ